MKIIRYMLSFMTLALLTTPTFAAPPGVPQLSSIEATQKINERDFSMIESAGKTFIVSASGRYVIRGTMYDMWQGKEIKNVSDLVKTQDYINLSNIGLKAQDLFHVTYGKGTKEVIVFMAPGCPHCKNTIEKMKGLEEEYTFQIVPLPILGKESIESTKKLLTAAEKNPEIALSAVLSDKYDNLPDFDPKTDLQGLQKSMIAAQILGLKGVPFIISPSFKTFKGEPKDLAAVLEEE